MNVDLCSRRKHSIQMRTRRRALIATAMLLCETKDHINLEAIALRSGLSKQVICHYYENSDEVITHSISTMADELDNDWNNYAARNGPVETLQYVIDLLLTKEGRAVIIAAHLGYKDTKGLEFREVLIQIMESFLEYFKDANMIQKHMPLKVIAEHHVNGMIGSIVSDRKAGDDYAWLLHDQLLRAIRVR
jgi:AcrR family transcriptional regulator